MEGQDGKELSITDHIPMQNDLREQSSESKCKNYMILNAKSTYKPATNKKFVKFVVQKPASYEAALEAAFDVFKIPEAERKKVSLRCRPKDSPWGTQWIRIQPAVWNEIVEDMEVRLFGYKTDMWP